MRAPFVIAICAAFDPAGDEAVEHHRALLAAAGVRERRAHRPHLTLTAARTGDLAAVIAAAATVAARHAPIGLRFTVLGTFGSGVLYLRAEPSAALAELQRDTYRTLAARWPPAFGGQSAPEHWQAHCTLATRLPSGALRRYAAEPIEPFDAKIIALTALLVGGRGDLALLPLGVADG